MNPFNFIFTGEFPDYGPTWYEDIGVSIVYTMTINAFMPYSNLSMIMMTMWFK